jgi:hypothetical protein
MAIWWATLRHNPHQGGGRWLAVMSHEWDQLDEHDDASTWFCTAFHQKTRIMLAITLASGGSIGAAISGAIPADHDPVASRYEHVLPGNRCSPIHRKIGPSWVLY